MHAKIASDESSPFVLITTKAAMFSLSAFSIEYRIKGLKNTLVCTLLMRSYHLGENLYIFASLIATRIRKIKTMSRIVIRIKVRPMFSEMLP